MASISTLKLKTVKPESYCVQVGDKEYNVKEFLTTDEKLKAVTDVLTNLAEFTTELNFMNVVLLEVFSWLVITEAYTDIKFTDKQKDEPTKTYDILNRSRIFVGIYDNAREDIDELMKYITAAAAELYRYKNSALGVLEAVQASYAAKKIDVEALTEQLNNPDNFAFLKEVMEKMG